MTGSGELSELSDVSITNPEQGDFLFYNNQIWENKNLEEASDIISYTINGGNADSFQEEIPEPPDFSNYAEELTYVLNQYINSEAFQSYVNTIKGLDLMNMVGNIINLQISEKFEDITNEIINQDDISRMVGRIITAIYDNISGSIRKILDDVETDLWLKIETAQINENCEYKIFVYMSDSSVVFYNIKVIFNL